MKQNALVQTRATRTTGRPLRPLLMSALASVLVGCAAVGPDYQAPELPASQGTWSQPLVDTTEPAELARWWGTLGDPQLQRLVETALAQNLDLRQAGARIAEARALRDRVAGGAQPSAGIGASVNRRQQSRNGPLPVGSIPGLDATQTIYDAGFDASWEPDLFGGQRRALESADATLEKAVSEAQAVRIRIAAEVAQTWFTAVGAGHELRARQDRLATLQQTLELVHRRHAAGDASAAEVDTASAQWASANADLPDVEARQHNAILALGTLLGEPPEAERGLLYAESVPLALRSLPVGQRADILRRRPDVIAAERQLAASTADIGVATAELFPKLSIGVGGGFQALSADDWFGSSSTRFSILPLVSWRIFDGGRVRAEIRAREARQQQAALAYEQAVLGALADAERALASYEAQLDTLARVWDALDANHRSFDHARARYAAGDIAQMELLATERLFHENAIALVRAHTGAATHMVALYKALGGGWDAAAEAPGAGTSHGDAMAATRARARKTAWHQQQT